VLVLYTLIVSGVISVQSLVSMLDRAALTAPILDLVYKAIPGARQRPAIEVDTDLHDAGLTSMAMVKLMLSIEAAFDVTIPDADLSPENFRSVRALETMVERLRTH
jgi:acyl carrier protein